MKASANIDVPVCQVPNIIKQKCSLPQIECNTKKWIPVDSLHSSSGGSPVGRQFMAIIEVFFLRVQFLSSQDDPRVVLRAYVASVYTSIKGSSSSSTSSSSSSGGTTIIPRSGKPCPPGMEEVPALYISRIDFAVSKDKLHLIMRLPNVWL